VNKVIKMSAVERTQIEDTNHLGDLLIAFCRLDDPLMWGAHGLPRFDPAFTRWVLTAEDICFTNPVYSYFFRLGERSRNSRSLIFHWRVRGEKTPPSCGLSENFNQTSVSFGWYVQILTTVPGISPLSSTSSDQSAPSAADCDLR
jgi:hypothetical protein